MAAIVLGIIFSVLGGLGTIVTAAIRSSTDYQLDRLDALWFGNGGPSPVDIAFYVSLGVLGFGVLLIIIGAATRASSRNRQPVFVQPQMNYYPPNPPPVPAPAYPCRRCGIMVNTGFAFCPRCGNTMNAAPPPPPPVPVPAPPPPPPPSPFQPDDR